MKYADPKDDPYSETKIEVKQESTDAAPGIELRPDGEERFRKAVRAAAKSGPKHRPAKEPKR